MFWSLGCHIESSCSDGSLQFASSVFLCCHLPSGNHRRERSRHYQHHLAASSEEPPNTIATSNRNTSLRTLTYRAHRHTFFFIFRATKKSVSDYDQEARSLRPACSVSACCGQDSTACMHTEDGKTDTRTDCQIDRRTD